MDNRDKRYYLGFIDELMAVTGTTKAHMAREMGTSWQNLQQRFLAGDVKMSKAEQMVSTMGYDVRFVMDDCMGRTTENGGRRDVAGLIMEISDLLPESGRLGPLKLFLRMHDKSIVQVAKDIGVTASAILKYFRNDDMYISRLFWIAESYGWKVEVKLTKKDN